MATVLHSGASVAPPGTPGVGRGQPGCINCSRLNTVPLRLAPEPTRWRHGPPRFTPEHHGPSGLTQVPTRCQHGPPRCQHGCGRFNTVPTRCTTVPTRSSKVEHGAARTNTVPTRLGPVYAGQCRCIPVADENLYKKGQFQYHFHFSLRLSTEQHGCAAQYSQKSTSTDEEPTTNE